MSTDNEISPVKVAVRIRPLIKNEIAIGCQRSLETVSNEPQIYVKGTDKSFTFNYVFDTDISQEHFYNSAIKNMIQNLFKGYNVTVLAYGQTGSGKTYTMGTTYEENVEEMGVIQRAVNDIFHVIETNVDNQFQVSVSFIELYQEVLYDLLAEKSREQSIVDIREDTHGTIKINGLTERVVTNVHEVAQYLKHASHLRVTGSTAMNSYSSRSHAIITITIQQQSKSDPNIVVSSKFHLVDLAGSERPKKTKTTGERFREGVKINQGLLALGNVISALGDEQKTHTYISYRDSKLTRLLQDSLGGNSITLMIACVSPADYNLDETISTLRYADRARKIKNKPIVNHDPRMVEMSLLHQQLKELKLQLDDCQNSDVLQELQKIRDENQMLKVKNNELMEQIQHFIAENTCLYERSMILENGRDRLVQKLTELNEVYTNAYDKLELPDEKLIIYKELGEKIQDIQNDCKHAEAEIIQHDTKQESDSVNESTEAKFNPLLYSTNFENDQDAHMRQQLEFNSQLQQITRTLAIKEQQAQQIAANSALHQVDKKSYYENERKMSALEKEKDELVQQFKNVQNTKLCEQRRTRIRDLEEQIQDLQRKLRDQARQIRIREGNDVKIRELNNEIANMKQTKIKLVRLMRQESDKFRQWKVDQQRELIRLKDQNRKRENEMLRLETMHAKQQTVLKRKVEEASAINKRLKDALALQKCVQDKRGLNNTNKWERMQQWVTQELEILVGTVEAERTLEHLITEHTKMLNKREKLLKQHDLNHSDSELHDLDHEIELCAQQITDLKQQIIDADQENRAKIRYNIVQSMSEAKFALKYLFELAAAIKRKKIIMESNYRDNIELFKTKLHCTEQKMCELSLKHEEYISKLEKEYEAKLFELVQQIYADKTGGGDQAINISNFLEKYTNKKLEDTNLGSDKEQSVYVCLNPIPVFNPEPKSLRKRSSTAVIRCKCSAGQCLSRYCGCRKDKNHCSASCLCTDRCLNKKSTPRLLPTSSPTNNNDNSTGRFSGETVFNNSFNGQSRYFELTGSVKTISLQQQ